MEKFGATSTPVPGASASQPRSVVEPLVVEAGGADHGVDAVADAELEVVHHHVGVGEVDDRLGAGRDQVVESSRRRRPRATSSRSSAASTAAADLGADLAARAQHADLDRRSRPT